jgi:hypothetical protein
VRAQELYKVHRSELEMGRSVLSWIIRLDWMDVGNILKRKERREGKLGRGIGLRGIEVEFVAAVVWREVRRVMSGAWGA